MIRITEFAGPNSKATDSLTLSFEYQQKSRQRVVLDSGKEAGLFLTRGSVIRGGDLLLAEDGKIIEVRAAEETVSAARSDNPILLAHACYHLGNRHVNLQIGEGCIRYQHDHVLDDMVASLGLSISSESAPFEPESGAYHGHSHGHAD